MSDLVKRLREACTNPARDAMDSVDHWNLEDEAADELERKDAAIAELVAALKPFADAYNKWDGGRATEYFAVSVTPYDFHNASAPFAKHHK